VRTMTKDLKKAAEDLYNLERSAYIRRVMWIDFEERLKSVFREIDGRGSDASMIGNLYLMTSIETWPAYRAPRLGKRYVYRFNSLNHAQVSVGCRHLPVWHALRDKTETVAQSLGPMDAPRPKQVAESDAAVVFSQDITGKITVMLFPYKSVLSSVNEQNIILKFGIAPNDLNEAAIRGIMGTFFRYCAATSMMSVGSYRSYFFRVWLTLNDFRNRNAQKNKLYNFLLPLLGLAATAIGTWGTIHFGWLSVPH